MLIFLFRMLFVYYLIGFSYAIVMSLHEYIDYIRSGKEVEEEARCYIEVAVDIIMWFITFFGYMLFWPVGLYNVFITKD